MNHTVCNLYVYLFAYICCREQLVCYYYYYIEILYKLECVLALMQYLW